MIASPTAYAEQQILRTYSLEDLRDICNQGCESGAAHRHIYYNQTWEFFSIHEDEIEDFFYNIYGEDWLKESTFIGPSVRHTVNQIVWAYIETIAANAIENA